MPTIDLGVNYDDVKDEDQFDPVPNATYDFIVGSIKPTTTAAGRPMLKWTLNITHEGKARKLFYNAVLPWEKDGEWDVGGVGMLVAITKAVGHPWTGSSLDTEDYIGRGGACEVVQEPKQVKRGDGSYVDDPTGKPVNNIKRFVY